jgi:hypothetical protein
MSTEFLETYIHTVKLQVEPEDMFDGRCQIWFDKTPMIIDGNIFKFTSIKEFSYKDVLKKLENTKHILVDVKSVKNTIK